MRPLLDTSLLELCLQAGMWEHLPGRVTAMLTSAERTGRLEDFCHVADVR